MLRFRRFRIVHACTLRCPSKNAASQPPQGACSGRRPSWENRLCRRCCRVEIIGALVRRNQQGDGFVAQITRHQTQYTREVFRRMATRTLFQIRPLQVFGSLVIGQTFQKVLIFRAIDQELVI